MSARVRGQLFKPKDGFNRYFIVSKNRDNDEALVEYISKDLIGHGFDVRYYDGKHSKYGNRYIKINRIPIDKNDRFLIDMLSENVGVLHNERDIIDVVEDLRKIFPDLRYMFISREQADQYGINPTATSFVKRGVVYFISGERHTIDTVLEECLHPLITAVQYQNTELFDKLLDEAKTRYGKLAKQIEKDYSGE